MPQGGLRMGECIPKASKEEIETWAVRYGITYADAMKYKSEWLTAIRNSEDRYAK